MSKLTTRELYAVPDWMRPYLPLFQNTGGNDVEELLHDDNTSMFANSIRYMLIVSARSQFTLLMDLHCRGLLSTVSDAFLDEVRAQGVEMLTSKLQSLIDEGNFEGDEIGVIAGAVYTGADIAAQIRKGVQS